MAFKRRIVPTKWLSLIVIAILVAAGPGRAAVTGRQLPVRAAAGAFSDVAGAKFSDEAALLESLFDLDIKLARAREEQARLSIQNAELEKQVRRSEIRRDQANDEMEAQRQAVSDWLRFVYEEGDIDFLAVLLEAEDFADFMVRWELFGIVTQRQTEFLNEVRKVVNSAKKEQESLVRLRSSLQQRKTRSAALAADLERNLAAKERLFLEMRSLGSGTAGSLTEAEARWVAAVVPLVRLFERFSSIPWTEAQPSKVNIDYRSGRVEVAVPVSELERVVRGADPLDQTLRLSIETGELVISVPPPEGGGQQAGLVVAGEIRINGKEAAFVPRRLSFRGSELSERVLRSLAGGYDLKINVDRKSVV
jgi:hypothetical protein